MKRIFEIKTFAGSDKLTTVSWSVFRSFAGERYVNGKRFYGRRFWYLSTERCDGPDSGQVFAD